MTDALLIGCVASKHRERRAACELYRGQLWDARRRYAELDGRPWLILSAYYGVVRPTDELDPYDLSARELNRLREHDTSEAGRWARTMPAGIAKDLWAFGVDHVELHAGLDYFRLLGAYVAQGGIVSRPLIGLGIGQQLGYYRRGRDAADQRAAAKITAAATLDRAAAL